MQESDIYMYLTIFSGLIGLLKASIFPFAAFTASRRKIKWLGFVSDPNLSNTQSKGRLRTGEDGEAEDSGEPCALFQTSCLYL